MLFIRRHNHLSLSVLKSNTPYPSISKENIDICPYLQLKCYQWFSPPFWNTQRHNQLFLFASLIMEHISWICISKGDMYITVEQVKFMSIQYPDGYYTWYIELWVPKENLWEYAFCMGICFFSRCHYYNIRKCVKR